jgi:branched-chain amino acid aminotransferase
MTGPARGTVRYYGPAIHTAVWAEETFLVFETVRISGDAVFLGEVHWKRLEESARSAGIPMASVRCEIDRTLRAALRAYRRDEPRAGRSLFARLSRHAGKWMVWIGPLETRSSSERTLRLRTCPVRKPSSHSEFAEIKGGSFFSQIMSYGVPDPLPEYLFLDAQGTVAETRVGNLFLTKNGALGTPPGQGILNGATRGFVLKCARRMKMPVEEHPLTRHELFNADEIFLTNTLWEVLPVVELDGRRIGAGVPGPWASTFKRLLQEAAKKGTAR